MEILKEEQFNTVKDLADLTLKISEARETLSRIEDEKDEYIAKREVETIEAINNLIKESEEMIQKAQKNFQKSSSLVSLVNDYVRNIDEAYTKLHDTYQLFVSSQDAWKVQVEKQTNELSDLKKKLDEKEKEQERAEKDLEQKKTLLDKEQTRINSRQAQIRAALQVLEQKEDGKRKRKTKGGK